VGYRGFELGRICPHQSRCLERLRQLALVDAVNSESRGILRNENLRMDKNPNEFITQMQIRTARQITDG